MTTLQETNSVPEEGAKAIDNAPNPNANGQSQTATEYINSQLQLEADAREVLPFSFDHCTQPLGPLRQNLFSCLTCNPPPASPSDSYQPAAVCYSCSIACHGEHTLVELFHRRNFTCDCGTTRLPATSPCTLRIDPVTGMKGPVHSEVPAEGNTYNHNFRNRFCGCGEWYDAHQEKGTMFQCLGLKDEAHGGCGEDWWHPECVVWGGEEGSKRRKEADEKRRSAAKPEEHKENGDADERAHEENQLPRGFPDEDDFDTFICYKCIDAVPWLKPYAGTEGFLAAVELKKASEATTNGSSKEQDAPKSTEQVVTTVEDAAKPTNGRKRSADEADLHEETTESKKAKAEPSTSEEPAKVPSTAAAYHTTLPTAPTGSISIFCKEDFRSSLCRCTTCYPLLSPFPHLLEEEDTYEPPVSISNEADEARSGGSKSIYDRGEEALSSVDRVRAIEGVMAYNHMKEKVKGFLKPFAESGREVSAEDIKAYFEKLRGDEQGIRGASDGAARASEGGEGSGGADGDGRREQSGY